MYWHFRNVWFPGLTFFPLIYRKPDKIQEMALFRTWSKVEVNKRSCFEKNWDGCTTGHYGLKRNMVIGLPCSVFSDITPWTICLFVGLFRAPLSCQCSVLSFFLALLRKRTFVFYVSQRRTASKSKWETLFESNSRARPCSMSKVSPICTKVWLVRSLGKRVALSLTFEKGLQGHIKRTQWMWNKWADCVSDAEIIAQLKTDLMTFVISLNSSGSVQKNLKWRRFMQNFEGSSDPTGCCDLYCKIERRVENTDSGDIYFMSFVFEHSSFRHIKCFQIFLGSSRCPWQQVSQKMPLDNKQEELLFLDTSTLRPSYFPNRCREAHKNEKSSNVDMSIRASSVW